MNKIKVKRKISWAKLVIAHSPNKAIREYKGHVVQSLKESTLRYCWRSMKQQIWRSSRYLVISSDGVESLPLSGGSWFVWRSYFCRGVRAFILDASSADGYFTRAKKTWLLEKVLNAPIVIFKLFAGWKNNLGRNSLLSVLVVLV